MKDFKEIKNKLTGKVKEINVKDLKTQVFKKSNLKNATFWGFILAAFCFVLVVIVPLAITNNEVKEAQAAAAAEAQKAFEEAKAAALEAERKAEEERMLALNSALAAEKAAKDAEEAARAAEEKAAAERQALIEEISKQTFATVSDIVNNQMEEDFNTQYSIQDNLIGTQNETVKYLQAATTVITGTVEGVKDNVSSVKDNVNSVRDDVTSIKDYMDEKEAEAVRLEKEKEEAHYGIRNHVDVFVSGAGSTFDFEQQENTVGNVAIGASFVHFIDSKLGIGASFGVYTDKNIDLMADVEYMCINLMKFNFSLKLGVGGEFDIAANKFSGACSLSAVARFTVTEGYELLFMPTAVFMPIKDSGAKAQFLPLTVGLSFAF